MPVRETLHNLFAEGHVIDVHVNVGQPAGAHVLDGCSTCEHVRRQFAPADLCATRLGGIGLRTHYGPVQVPPTEAARFIPSVALNWTGMDAARVESELRRFAHPHPMIWFQSFRDPYHRSVMDAAYRGSIAAGGEEHGSVTHTDAYGRLTDAALAVLEVARARGAVVATPHANWERTVPLIMQAVDMGLRVLWVHPDSRLIRTPLDVQQTIAAYGKGQAGKGAVFVERAAVFLRDGKPGAYSAERVVAEARAIGLEHMIFSSDLGRYKQADPLLPDDGLLWYLDCLQAAGLTDAEARQGVVVNPRRYIYGVED
jgi:hypothetical protein